MTSQQHPIIQGIHKKGTRSVPCTTSLFVTQPRQALKNGMIVNTVSWVTASGSIVVESPFGRISFFPEDRHTVADNLIKLAATIRRG